MDQCRNTRAELHPGVTGGVDIIRTRLQLFGLFPPKELIKVVFIPQTNKSIMEEGGVLTYGWFLMWIELWFIMATIQGFLLCDV